MLLCLLGQYLKKRYQKPLKISSELCHDYISFFFFNSWLLDFHVLGKREMMPKPPPHYFFRLPTQRWNIWWSGQKMSKFCFLVHWIFTWHDMSHFSMSVFQLRVSPALSAGWNIFTNLLARKILFEPMFEPALRCLLGSIISGRKKGSRCYVVH